MLYRLRFLYVATVMGILSGGVAMGAMAANCDPANLQPNGLTLRDLSRESGGTAGTDAATYVYFQVCESTNTITRTTIAQPFQMALAPSCADEVKGFNVSLKGRYYSVRRMNDMFANFDPTTNPNPRIGYEYVTGNVVDNATGAAIGTFEMNGTIGTNTSRLPLPDGLGKCYDCVHHQGYVTMKFSVAPYNNSAVFSEYHFHTGTSSEYCDHQDPCQIDFQYFGAVDGIYLSRCVAGAVL